MDRETVRTSLDIPRDLHARIRERAARQGCSARQLILRSIERELESGGLSRPERRLSLEVPIVPSRGKPFDLTPEQIYDLIDMP